MRRYTPKSSWPEALTDWCVIQAFERAGCPPSLRASPALAAAFVSAISSVIRFKTFAVRDSEITVRLETAAESAYEQTGGPAYLAVRAAAAFAEEAYLRRLGRLRSPGRTAQFRAQWQQRAADLAAHRRRLESAARPARRYAARAYWAEKSLSWIDDRLCSHLRANHPALRVAALCPVWWELFFACLQSEFSRRSLPDFHLLDVLPDLRRQAVRSRKKVLAALVDEWRESQADQLGLSAPLHYHVLESRAGTKARAAAYWFNDRVPGYHTDHRVFESAREALDRHLAELPATTPASFSRN